MPRLDARKYTYFKTVRGMCRTCREIRPARIYFQDGAVWQETLCPDCTTAPAKIAADAAWYMKHILQPLPDHAPLPHAQPSGRGCPHDCGPCHWHASPCQLPVFSITNACNLRCPICFTHNRNDRIYHMSQEEMEARLDWIVAATGQVDLVNITGGEPTLHPQLTDLLRCCQRPEIGRITMNSNGIRLAQDKALCKELADMNVYVILSFNTFDPEISHALHGEDLIATKMKAIENLTSEGVKITLLNVMVRDTNEESIGGIFELMRTHDNILSLTVQTMTYTGQGGGAFSKHEHMPVDEAARMVCAHSDGDLVFDDFLTRPSAHPLCYLTSYMLKTGDRFLPLTRLAPTEQIQDLMRDGYLIRLEREPDFFREAIDRLYANGDTTTLRKVRKTVEAMFPTGKSLTAFERQHLAESAIRTVYIHAHMDEDTFDCSRAAMCPDLVPSEPGKMIPACTYNLFYRQQDARFYETR